MSNDEFHGIEPGFHGVDEECDHAEAPVTRTEQRYPDGSTVLCDGFQWTVELMCRDGDALLPSQTDRGEDFNLYRLSRHNTKSVFRWQHELDVENTVKEVNSMQTVEMRGVFQVTIYPEYEEWRLSYTDGSLGQPDIVTAESRFPECSKCKRWWSPQDRDIRFNPDDGTMICPDCRAKAEVICPDCECPTLWSDISGWACQCDPSDMLDMPYDHLCVLW